MADNDTLDALLEKTPNLILGMKNCSDCTEALEIIGSSGMFFGYCPRETYPGVVEEVKTKFDHKTFPAIFVDKQFIGDEKKFKEHMENTNKEKNSNE